MFLRIAQHALATLPVKNFKNVRVSQPAITFVTEPISTNTTAYGCKSYLRVRVEEPRSSMTVSFCCHSA